MGRSQTLRKAPEGAKPSAFSQSLRRAKRAETAEELREVMLDIAERALAAGHAVHVDSIAKIAVAAARRDPNA